MMITGIERKGDGAMLAERIRKLWIPALLLVLLSVTLTACANRSIQFVDDGNVYDLDSVTALQASVALPATEGSPVADSPDLRRDALIELRAKGDAATELAEFVTKNLPDNGRSVPYYGEAATVDGDDVWVLLELWGAEEGVLDQTRVWVFDRATGTVIFSAAGQ